MPYSHFMPSGWFGPAIRDKYGVAAASPAATGSAIKVVLFDSQATSGAGLSDPDAAAAYGTGFWSAANYAMTGAGQIKTLSTVSVSSTAGVWKMGSADTNLQWTSLDSSFAGLFIYNDDASDLGLGFINFGADTTVNGTLTFTPDPTYGWLSIIY